MTKFFIEQKQPSFQIWNFEVVAENEEEALKLVISGDVDPVDYTVYSDEDSEYDVYDEEKISE